MVELLEVCQSKRPAAMLFGHVHNQNGTSIVDGVVYSNGALDTCRRNVASVIDFWLPAESDLGKSGGREDQREGDREYDVKEIGNRMCYGEDYDHSPETSVLLQ